MSNIIDLDSYRNDVIYIEYDGEIGGVTIDNIKIDFMDDSVMIEVLDGIQTISKDDFTNLIIAYLALERVDLLKFDDESQ